MKIIDRDITGFRGPKFTVLRRGSDRTKWICLCDCGKEFEVGIYPIMAGTRKSCGSSCGRKIHGYVGTKVYRAWQGMFQRCLNPKSQAYKDYGGRGITICAEWQENFLNFLRDMGESAPGLTLERKDVHGHYTPDNCVWATLKEQNRNQRNRANLTVDGVTKPVWQWAEETNQVASTLYSRIRKGWRDREALWGRLEPRPKKPRGSKPKYRQAIMAVMADGKEYDKKEIVAKSRVNREDARRELLYMLAEDLVEVREDRARDYKNAKCKYWKLRR